MNFAINQYLITVFLLSAASLIQAQMVIRFQPHINAHPQRIDDLLRITPDPNHLGKITLDSQPQSGAHLNKEQVLSWLENKAGKLSYQWHGKSTTTISMTVRTYAKELMDKAHFALRKQLINQGYTQVQLNSRTVLKDSEIPLAEFTVQLPTGFPPAKRVCVRLRAKNHSFLIWFSVKAHQVVLVAKHKLKSHSVMDQKYVVVQQRNVAGLPHRPLTKLPENVWTQHSINKNQILTEADLRDLPEVIQGQKVTVNLVHHAITILAEARAQSDGYSGQVIRMKNPQTDTFFFAVITGKNQAEILE